MTKEDYKTIYSSFAENKYKFYRIILGKYKKKMFIIQFDINKQ